MFVEETLMFLSRHTNSNCINHRQYADQKITDNLATTSTTEKLVTIVTMLTLVSKTVIIIGPCEVHLFFSKITIIIVCRQLLEKVFYIYCSVHRNTLWNKQQMRQCAVKFISLQVHSTCFGRHTRPSSGVQF